MSVTFPPAELNVLLLYDYNPQWTPVEKDEVAEAHSRLTDALAGSDVDARGLADETAPEAAGGFEPEIAPCWPDFASAAFHGGVPRAAIGPFFWPLNANCLVTASE